MASCLHLPKELTFHSAGEKVQKAACQVMYTQQKPLDMWAAVGSSQCVLMCLAMAVPSLDPPASSEW